VRLHFCLLTTAYCLLLINFLLIDDHFIDHGTPEFQVGAFGVRHFFDTVFSVDDLIFGIALRPAFRLRFRPWSGRLFSRGRTDGRANRRSRRRFCLRASGHSVDSSRSAFGGGITGKPRCRSGGSTCVGRLENFSRIAKTTNAQIGSPRQPIASSQLEIIGFGSDAPGSVSRILTADLA